jgi:hypothetical protein
MICAAAPPQANCLFSPIIYCKVSCSNQNERKVVYQNCVTIWNVPHTCLKVNRYDVVEDSPDGENEWTSSNESISSVVGSSGSITPELHSLKSSTKSSFDVSSPLLSGCSMIGSVVNLPLATPPKEDWLAKN